MNLKLLIFIFILGVTLGFLTFGSMDSPTGLAANNPTAACFVENNPCSCNSTDCICGDLIVDSSICNTKKLPKQP